MEIVLVVGLIVIVLVLIAGADAPRRRKSRRTQRINLFALKAAKRAQTPDFLLD